MIQEDIYKLLSEDSGVKAIVSTRIYPVEIPQGINVPAIVYETDITPIKSLDGESGIDNGNIEITCWAKDYKTVHLLAAAVRAAFVGSKIGVITGNMQDTIDPETRNYGVIINVSAWSK